MGFLDMLNRVSNNLNQEKETPEGNKSEIARLQELSEYSNNSVIQALLEIAPLCQKVSFGTRFISDIDSVRKDFSICNDEKIIVSVRNQSGIVGVFSKVRFVISDKAIYTQRELGEKSRRIPFEELPLYIAALNDNESTIWLSSREENIRIMHRAGLLSYEGEAEFSVATILCAIRKAVMLLSNENADVYKEISNHLFSVIESDMASGLMEKATRRKTKGRMMDKDEDAELFAILYLKNGIRSCIYDDIVHYLNDVYRVYKEKTRVFFEAALEQTFVDLKNPKLLLNPSVMNASESNTYQTEERSYFSTTILENKDIKECFSVFLQKKIQIRELVHIRAIAQRHVSKILTDESLESEYFHCFSDDEIIGKNELIKFFVEYKNRLTAESGSDTKRINRLSI